MTAKRDDRLALATIALGPSAAQAHEIGTTQVHALFRKDHTYAIDVITAPQALANKIETQRHERRSSALMYALSLNAV